MKKSQGTIRAKGRCPKCGEKFSEIKGIGFICLKHETVPKKLFVDLPWKGDRVRIFSDKTGKPLDSYDRAQEVLKHLHYEISNHTFDPEKYIKAEASKFWTVNLLDRFLASKIEGVAPSYRKDCTRMVTPAKTFFKTQDVRELRKVHVIEYKEHLETTFKKWSPKTLKNCLGLFKTFMRYLRDDLEVIDKVPSFPDIDVQEPAFKWLSTKDQVTLFKKVPDPDKPIVAFLMLHGCRPGEARALKCKDVDIENECITIRATFSKSTYREKRKGKKARSVTIPIHPEMLGYLTASVGTSLPEAFVFINPRTSRPYSQDAMTRIWNNVREGAKIGKELRLYDASRHSFASQLVNSGTSLFKVSKLLGHSSVKMTEKYAHQHIDSLRSELSKITLTQKTVTNLSPAQEAVDERY